MILTKAVRAGIAQWRNSSTNIEGKSVPGSIPFIRGMIMAVEDPFNRDLLLGALADEYFRAELDDEHLLILRERVAAQPEAAVTWIGLADALSLRANDAQEARSAVAKGVEITLRENSLVRYALMSQANIARRVNDGAWFEQSIRQLIDDSRVERLHDADFTEELVLDLPNDFCSHALVEEYRRVANHPRAPDSP